MNRNLLLTPSLTLLIYTVKRVKPPRPNFVEIYWIIYLVPSIELGTGYLISCSYILYCQVGEIDKNQVKKYVVKYSIVWIIFKWNQIGCSGEKKFYGTRYKDSK